MARRKTVRGGVGHKRHTKSVGDFGDRVKLFEREFAEEITRIKKLRKGAAFDRWAARRMATFAAIAATVSQRKRAA